MSEGKKLGNKRKRRSFFSLENSIKFSLPLLWFYSSILRFFRLSFQGNVYAFRAGESPGSSN